MLIDKLLFSDKIPLVLKKGLDFHSARNLMLSTNISNMETPDFKAHDINFEALVCCHFLGSFGHAGRGHVVGRFIDHVAGCYGRPGNGAAQLDPNLDGLGAVFIQFDHGQFLEFVCGSAALRQIDAELVET